MHAVRRLMVQGVNAAIRETVTAVCRKYQSGEGGGQADLRQRLVEIAVDGEMTLRAVGDAADEAELMVLKTDKVAGVDVPLPYWFEMAAIVPKLDERIFRTVAHHTRPN